jgi:hypothetical protein
MWAIANYYKDQEEELEKYKLICRFINPNAAHEIFDGGTAKKETIERSNVNEEAVLAEIMKHTKTKLSAAELKDRIYNPEEYDISKVDSIERVEE